MRPTNTNEIRFYLHSYVNLEKEIKNLKESLDIYRQIDGIKAQIITDMPIYHSDTSPVERTAIQKEGEIDILDGRRMFLNDLLNEIDTKRRVFDAINSVYFYLREPARTIIEMRYFITPIINDVRQPKYNWKQIADEVHLEENTCMKIDGKVVRRIQHKLLGK